MRFFAAEVQGGVVNQTYDNMSRLIGTSRVVQRVTNGNGNTTNLTLTTAYSYDQLGQRLRQVNAANEALLTDYDGLGRVTRTVSAEGFVTSYQYQRREAGAADGVLGTAAQNIGGTVRTTTQADGRSIVDKIDYFGRTTWHQDLSGNA